MMLEKVIKLTNIEEGLDFLKEFKLEFHFFVNYVFNLTIDPERETFELIDACKNHFMKFLDFNYFIGNKDNLGYMKWQLEDFIEEDEETFAKFQEYLANKES